MSDIKIISYGMHYSYRVGSVKIDKGMPLTVNERSEAVPATSAERVVGIAMDSYDPSPLTSFKFTNRVTDFESSGKPHITVIGPNSELYLTRDCFDTNDSIIAGEHLTIGQNGKFRVAGHGDSILAIVLDSPQLLPTGIPDSYEYNIEGEPITYVRIAYTGRNQLPLNRPVNQPLPEQWGDVSLPDPVGIASFTDDELSGIHPVPDKKEVKAIDMEKPKLRKYLSED